MSKRSDHVGKQWRSTRRFAIFFPFLIIFIVGSNLWRDEAAGKPFDWLQFWAAVGMIAFGGLVYLFCTVIFRVVLAKINYDERRR
ncbi:MAG: hypothetical protein V4459_04735 [Pseudomonadota bacterium]